MHLPRAHLRPRRPDPPLSRLPPTRPWLARPPLFQRLARPPLSRLPLAQHTSFPLHRTRATFGSTKSPDFCDGWIVAQRSASDYFAVLSEALAMPTTCTTTGKDVWPQSVCQLESDDMNGKEKVCFARSLSRARSLSLARPSLFLVRDRSICPPSLSPTYMPHHLAPNERWSRSRRCGRLPRARSRRLLCAAQLLAGLQAVTTTACTNSNNNTYTWDLLASVVTGAC